MQWYELAAVCVAWLLVAGVSVAWLVVAGRGGNSWLSPDGCAMFSVHVRVALSSRLGHRVSFIQHLMSLAVVLAVRRKPACQVRPSLQSCNLIMGVVITHMSLVTD